MSEQRRYELMEALGTGGFGTVYRARYMGEGGFSQMVALKVLNPEMAGVAEIASRLRDEARVLGLVRHRAIVQVHRLVRLDDAWTVVMEYVDGANLAQVLSAGIPVPVGPALEITSEVAAALHVAYTSPGPEGRPLKLLHRDIKPSNVQVTAVGEVKVLDFGIARADFDDREAHTRKLAFGSMEYMAPERLDLLDGPEADVYSLGTVLFELLTGRGFGRTSAVRERHVPRVDMGLGLLREHLGNKHDPVIELIGDMLAWDPKHRPEARTVERRALSLRGHMGGEPLRFWAEDVVPAAMSVRGPVDGDARTGSILIERTGQGTSSEPIGNDTWGRDREQVADAAQPMKRRPSDPTEAPSVAFALGAAPKPVQLGPAPSELPPVDDETAEEQPIKFVPSAQGPPSSPTLVALMDADTDIGPDDNNLAAGTDDIAPFVAPPELTDPGLPIAGRDTPADTGADAAADMPADTAAGAALVRPPSPRVGGIAGRAPVAPRPAAELVAENVDPAPGDAASAEGTGLAEDDPDAAIFEPDPYSVEIPSGLPLDEDSVEWTPSKRRNPAVMLFGIAALVLFCGLGGALINSLMGGDGDATVDADLPTEDIGDLSALDGITPAPGPSVAPPPDIGGSAKETPPPAPVETAPAATSAEPAAQPSSAEPDGWSRDDAPAATSSGSSSSAPKPAPKPAPEATPEPQPEPPAPAPAMAKVKITGDVSSVTLRGASGTFTVSNGPVPAGNYEIWVTFAGRADQAAGKAGSISLSSGESVTLKCDQAFAECRKR